jgi:hypothetical protein
MAKRTLFNKIGSAEFGSIAKEEAYATDKPIEQLVQDIDELERTVMKLGSNMKLIERLEQK